MDDHCSVGVPVICHHLMKLTQGNVWKNISRWWEKERWEFIANRPPTNPVASRPGLTTTWFTNTFKFSSDSQKIPNSIVSRTRSLPPATRQSPTPTPGVAMAATNLGKTINFQNFTAGMGTRNPSETVHLQSIAVQVLNLWRNGEGRDRSCDSVWLPGDRQLPVPGNGRGDLHRQLCRRWKWLQTNVSIKESLFRLPEPLVKYLVPWTIFLWKCIFRISRSPGRAGRMRGRVRGSRALAKRKGRRRKRRLLQKEEQEKQRSKVVKEKVLEERRRRVRRLKPQWGSRPCLLSTIRMCFCLSSSLIRRHEFCVCFLCYSIAELVFFVNCENTISLLSIVDSPRISLLRNLCFFFGTT